MLAIRKIGVATDFSADAMAAARFAVDLAAALGASIVLFHVREGQTVPSPQGGLALPPEMIADQIKALRAELARQGEALQAIAHVPIEARLVEGTPVSETIVVAADQENVDLLVLGTQGRTGLPRLLIGSVAERVVRHCKRPVLTIRHGG